MVCCNINKRSQSLLLLLIRSLINQLLPLAFIYKEEKSWTHKFMLLRSRPKAYVGPNGGLNAKTQVEA